MVRFMTNPFNSGPNAPERNPPIEPENFQPSRFVISAITLGSTTTVTTEEDHNYIIGQLVRTLIPPTYGTRQLNEQTSYVISIPADDQVVLNINSIAYDTFISSPTYGPTEPQIVAVGDVSSGIISSTGSSIPSTSIPGAFINISPQ